MVKEQKTTQKLKTPTLDHQITRGGETKLMSVDEASQDASRHPVLVVVSGNLLDVGRILPIGKEPVFIGRDTNTDLPLNDRLVSRKHIEIATLKEDVGGYTILVRDLSSTNGTFVKGKRISEAWIRLGETVEIGAETILLFRTESFSSIQDRNLILSMVSKDSLTGVYNRRAFEQLIEHVHEKFLNTTNCYSLLLIDVDHFKTVNDTFGHPAGDKVLRSIAMVIRSEIRAEDIVARLGGDEFAIILPHSRSAGATKLATRLLRRVKELCDEFNKPLNLTLSIGISEDRGSKLKTAEVYKQADIALYQSKQKGRDGWSIYSSSYEDLTNIV
ncbi:GGDEF domain-containing protein [bacterium]|nr:GGDEF domain-containing protein [candidate division CSSED10-310 bacterium]